MIFINYFISDLHFGHVNALSFDNRPFTEIEKHDEALIKNWNERVGIDDEVYVLGDISFHNATKTAEIFSSLNGKKHLIKGNHDGKLLKGTLVRNQFVEICDYKELYVGDNKYVVLSHYPIVCFRGHYYGWVHLYGHVHDSYEWNIVQHQKFLMEQLYDKQCNMFNVGCMIPYMNYCPRTLEEIINANSFTG